MKTMAFGFRVVLAIGLLASGGCGKNEEAKSPPAPPSMTTPKETPPPTPVPAPSPEVKPAVDTPKPAAELPKAEDVLPPGEVSKGSLVVVGDGYRYQVKPVYQLVDHPRGKPAYQATIAGIISEAQVTLYVVREPFTSDLDALVKQEKEKVTSKGGKVVEDMAVKIHIAGTLGAAHRFFAIVDGRLDLHVMAVHDGAAYVFHAETPNKNNPWPNVGSDMMIRGATFHVAPPK